jgi:hypothetical protein
MTGIFKKQEDLSHHGILPLFAQGKHTWIFLYEWRRKVLENIKGNILRIPPSNPEVRRELRSNSPPLFSL